LESEIGSSKSFGVGSACPLRGPIADKLTPLNRLLSLNWLLSLNRLLNQGIAQFCQTHGGSRQVLPELQAKVPDPLREDLPKLLPTGSMGNPTIRVLLNIFIGEHGLKGPSVQV
jgi:hypothetical protein